MPDASIDPTDPDALAALVRRVVTRTLGQTPRRRPVGRPIVDAPQLAAAPAGSTVTLPPDAIVTPLARQVAVERRLTLVDKATAAPRQTRGRDGRQTVALGADHGGFALKEALKELLEELGYAVVDCGTHSTASVDYPDFAYAVARLVADGRAWRGIIVDGAGIGSCMAANKVPDVRAAMCYDQATAVNSREHNNANVLTLGAGLIGSQLARQIVTTWLATPFGGGRHARRVAKIDALDGRYDRT